ncbi:type II toxin-antitoxin system HicA family toxin [Spirosoma montaniterrae]|uniref:Type II toxin-antitoxin system HicA family toxin n=1 Tax=Spirosoma montaniterrae TaxID=1178516 RepID=A0A1P9WSN9_9BACT|nr:type II toxin-antitoxin system HicA family toxin [Spirosoma montaniterrae]AQG78369.1 hypothetical protein AWR27_02870 [Spirosoma montaniterrae]
MRIPRDLTGIQLIKLLKPFGYEVVRQTGSHVRIETTQNGQHHETIPRHDPIKIGTLNNILKNVADHFDLTKEELAQKLFK